MTTPHSPHKRNFRIVVEYDGSNYVGWQHQKNGISVQKKLEEALSRQIGAPVRVNAAGRTDAGVHAMGQVVNFFASTSMTVRAIERGTLAYLPRDIAIVSADEVPLTFDARRSAKLRWYRYFISNRSSAPSVGRQYLTHVKFKLNLPLMQEAAALFTGHHDFRAFRATTCTAIRTRLTMRPVIITPLRENILQLDFQCQSFLQNMIRIMTGTLISVARGKMEMKRIREMLETGERANEAVTLAPNGLFLYKVFYDEDSLTMPGEP